MAEIEVTRRERVATILLNRPERRNALSSPMMADLGRAIGELDRDPDVRAVVLTGAGTVFCSGLDLGRMADSPGEPALETDLVDVVLKPLEQLSKPTFAAMNGDALAGGLELALHCDFRLAVPTGRFGMPVARIGIVVPYPLILKLIDTVGPAATSELLFTGEPVTAERALALGMVNRLVPAESLQQEAARTADAIAGNAPLAVQAMKRAILAGRAQRALPAPDDVREAAARARSSADAREGIRAIVEKRKPDFQGR
ncbi:MAG TPA: enoyl-CoA hydratase/isomerase family protein [Candidatus Binatia bacterium]|nr:enoyl-CoA hydratase/isomerase family protein [Candidatus Binatia bacterium]